MCESHTHTHTLHPTHTYNTSLIFLFCLLKQVLLSDNLVCPWTPDHPAATAKCWGCRYFTFTFLRMLLRPVRLLSRLRPLQRSLMTEFLPQDLCGERRELILCFQLPYESHDTCVAPKCIHLEILFGSNQDININWLRKKKIHWDQAIVNLMKCFFWGCGRC